jgi:hypothetical protein
MSQHTLCSSSSVCFLLPRLIHRARRASGGLGVGVEEYISPPVSSVTFWKPGCDKGKRCQRWGLWLASRWMEQIQRLGQCNVALYPLGGSGLWLPGPGGEGTCERHHFLGRNGFFSGMEIAWEQELADLASCQLALWPEEGHFCKS